MILCLAAWWLIEPGGCGWDYGLLRVRREAREGLDGFRGRESWGGASGRVSGIPCGSSHHQTTAVLAAASHDPPPSLRSGSSDINSRGAVTHSHHHHLRTDFTSKSITHKTHQRKTFEVFMCTEALFVPYLLYILIQFYYMCFSFHTFALFRAFEVFTSILTNNFFHVIYWLAWFCCIH